MMENISKIKLFFLRIKRKALARHLSLVRFSMLLLAFIFILFTSKVVSSSVSKTIVGDVFKSAYAFLFMPEGTLETYEDKTNILILGKAGEGSDSPDLTDTIIVASVDHIQKKIDLISIPRDIWSADINLKINEAYKIGNQKEINGGLKLSKSLNEKIVGIPLHYALVFDLSGLENVIDILGGVEVEVQKTFTDEKFPISGKENDECQGDIDYKCRYETITFEKGLQTMNGETAMKFARSRHSTDLEEGTDFARAQRQQLIISAISNKVFKTETLFSISKLRNIYGILRQKIETDLTDPQAALVLRLFAESRQNISRNVITDELLENPPLIEKYNYLYVLIPKEENWEFIHNWVMQIID